MYAVKKKAPPARKLKVVDNEVEFLDRPDEAAATGSGMIEPRFPDDEGDSDAERLALSDRLDILVEASKLARKRLEYEEDASTDPFAIADAMVAWCLKDA